MSPRSPEKDTRVVVALDGCSLGYGLVPSLTGVSFSLDAGERVAVVGPTGVGKSLFAKTLVGLRRPTAGSYRFFDADTASDEGRAALRRRTAMAFQQGGLLDGFSALENVVIPLREARGLSRAAAEKKARAALAALGLADHGDKPPEALSGGMRKRVGVARALALEPELLVLDEPTAGLDPVTAAALLAELHERLQKSGSALVVATADPELGKQLATRVLVLEEKTLLADGTWDHVAAHGPVRAKAFLLTAAGGKA